MADPGHDDVVAPRVRASRGARPGGSRSSSRRRPSAALVAAITSPSPSGAGAIARRAAGRPARRARARRRTRSRHLDCGASPLVPRLATDRSWRQPSQRNCDRDRHRRRASPCRRPRSPVSSSATSPRSPLSCTALFSIASTWAPERWPVVTASSDRHAPAIAVAAGRERRSTGSSAAGRARAHRAPLAEPRERLRERLPRLQHARREQIAVPLDALEHGGHRERRRVEVRRRPRPTSSGVETGAPGRGRTEYADAIVLPSPFWFASISTPRRVAFDHSVVASFGCVRAIAPATCSANARESS